MRSINNRCLSRSRRPSASVSPGHLGFPLLGNSHVRSRPVVPFTRVRLRYASSLYPARSPRRKASPRLPTERGPRMPSSRAARRLQFVLLWNQSPACPVLESSCERGLQCHGPIPPAHPSKKCMGQVAESAISQCYTSFSAAALS